MASIVGPDEISMETKDQITQELKALPEPEWLWAHAEIHLDGRELVVFARIPDDDPFEPHRLDRIFERIEHIIIAHVPHDIPIRNDGESWSVNISTEGYHATIDGTSGGKRVAHRTLRLSDGVGPPQR